MKNSFGIATWHFVLTACTMLPKLSYSIRLVAMWVELQHGKTCTYACHACSGTLALSYVHTVETTRLWEKWDISSSHECSPPPWWTHFLWWRAACGLVFINQDVTTGDIRHFLIKTVNHSALIMNCIVLPLNKIYPGSLLLPLTFLLSVSLLLLTAQFSSRNWKTSTAVLGCARPPEVAIIVKKFKSTAVA